MQQMEEILRSCGYNYYHSLEFQYFELFYEGGNDVELDIRYPREYIEELRQKVDIVKMVSEYISLTKADGQYCGVCPFHEDNDEIRSLDFKVDAVKKYYRCNTCDIQGDVYSFLMNIHHIDFVTAVRLIEEKIKLKFWDKEEEEVKVERKRRRKTNASLNKMDFSVSAHLEDKMAETFIYEYETRRKHYNDSKEGVVTYTKSMFLREIIDYWLKNKCLENPITIAEPEKKKDQNSLETAITKVISKMLLKGSG